MASGHEQLGKAVHEYTIRIICRRTSGAGAKLSDAGLVADPLGSLVIKRALSALQAAVSHRQSAQGQARQSAGWLIALPKIFAGQTLSAEVAGHVGVAGRSDRTSKFERFSWRSGDRAPVRHDEASVPALGRRRLKVHSTLRCRCRSDDGRPRRARLECRIAGSGDRQPLAGCRRSR